MSEGQGEKNPEAAKILVAEDERDIAEMIRYVLESRGLNVISTDNGLRAWELIREHRPDVVITDILMPGMTGLELCQRIRQDDSMEGTRIIVITSVTQDSDLADGFWRMAADSDDFITKPFSPVDLAERVNGMLEMPAADSDPEGDEVAGKEEGQA